MSSRLHSLLLATAHRQPERPALLEAGKPVTYGVLALRVEAAARGLVAFGLQFAERVAIWLPKTTDAVVATFATSLAGGVFVPVHAGLRSAQASHILRDAGAAVLVTTTARLAQIVPVLETLPELRTVLLVDGAPSDLCRVPCSCCRSLPSRRSAVASCPRFLRMPWRLCSTPRAAPGSRKA
jgi:acyl-CoA synthetase (AMP-forming)/AMP-acid ligase II